MYIIILNFYIIIDIKISVTVILYNMPKIIIILSNYKYKI